ncbi:MAG: hypothetical protein GQ565_07370 [Candidatus Aegiribacteria sp.]|nr:hypothetical protein [Candidatus Aegiribacteria sp.]
MIKSVPSGESRLVIATGRYIREGFDDTRLDTLFLTPSVNCTMQNQSLPRITSR